MTRQRSGLVAAIAGAQPSPAGAGSFMWPPSPDWRAACWPARPAARAGWPGGNRAGNGRSGSGMATLDESRKRHGVRVPGIA